jgi:rare lipoprotein A
MFTLVRFILHITIFILLSACTPHYNINGTCTGKNKACYSQYGKQYKVMKTSKNYSETGVASWYGHQFNKKRTSSGERFNMYHMTAAHKTLPLSTYVQVTNLKNGKHVIVKVNDRGPFVSNRLIDLSYAAAKKIGMVNRGVTPVVVKAV